MRKKRHILAKLKIRRLLAVAAALSILPMGACTSDGTLGDGHKVTVLGNCQSADDCSAGNTCVPYAGGRSVCAPEQYASVSAETGPLNQPAPPAVFLAGPTAAQNPDHNGIRSSAFALGGTNQDGMNLAWHHNMGATIDGAALGDVDGDGKLEIAVLIRNGTYLNSGTTQKGSIVLLGSDGAFRWAFHNAANIAGFPTFGDFDGDEKDEIAFCELSSYGYCHVLNGDGSLRYSFGPYYYPGQSGAGPSAADVNGDGADDILMHSWGGILKAVDGTNGTVLWNYNAWTEQGELLQGHVSVGDLDGDGVSEVIFGGASHGKLIVLDGTTGQEKWVSTDPGQLGHYFFGNGPLLADLDNNGTLEIVLSLPGTEPAIIAYSATGNRLWRTPAEGASFAWQHPIAADSNLTNTLNIISQSGDGKIRLLSHTGSVLKSATIGSGSWVAPSFVDVDYDLKPEIVATSTESVVVLDGQTLDEIDRYVENQINGGLQPSPLVADVDRDGNAELITGSYSNKKLLTFRLGPEVHPNLFRWDAEASNRRHTGRLDIRGASLDVDDILDLIAIFQKQLKKLSEDNKLTGKARSALKKLHNKLQKYYRKLLRAEEQDVQELLLHMIEDLQKITDHNTQKLQKQVAFIAIRLLEEFIERVQAFLDASDGNLLIAHSKLALAYQKLFNGDWKDAAEVAEYAAMLLESHIDYSGNSCNKVNKKLMKKQPYLKKICRLQQRLSKIDDLVNAHPNHVKLKNVQKQLRQVIVRMSKLKIHRPIDAEDGTANDPYTMELIQEIVDELKTINDVDTKDIQKGLAEDAQILTKNYVSDVDNSELNPEGVTLSTTQIGNGNAFLSAGDYPGAINAFNNATGSAQPSDEGNNDGAGDEDGDDDTSGGDNSSGGNNGSNIVPPALISHASGATLSGTSETFSWTSNTANVSEYWVYVGTFQGGSNIQNSQSINANTSSFTVNSLPTNGGNIYFRLWWRDGSVGCCGPWSSVDYQFVAAGPSFLPNPPAGAPTITNFAMGAKLPGSSATFNWAANSTTVTEWWLYVGTFKGGRNINDSGSLGLATSHAVSGLPTNGGNVFVRLWYKNSAGWASVDYQFIAAK